ncbi:MAG: hypothetical protein GOVbin3661_73 [Prokaryotic dsDNA virus sp.]|jgi:hypothetical protein|nr:MAG: hypothetical protein GOVbin3661_73 [Prokaryotic dsDNA virus sp.]|tara:strand:+ start:392 stop:661 length:270 start_codon:yes stop_codon:yes gene_type:complete
MAEYKLIMKPTLAEVTAVADAITAEINKEKVVYQRKPYYNAVQNLYALKVNPPYADAIIAVIGQDDYDGLPMISKSNEDWFPKREKTTK